MTNIHVKFKTIHGSQSNEALIIINVYAGFFVNNKRSFSDAKFIRYVRKEFSL